MRTTEARTIGDLDFEVGQLKRKDAQAVLVRLTKTLGPAFAEILRAPENGGPAALAGAVTKFAGLLSEEDLEHVYQKFAAVSKVRAPEGDAMLLLTAAGDTVFAGRTGTLLQFIVAAVEVNYADFLEYLRAVMPKAKGQTPPNPEPSA